MALCKVKSKNIISTHAPIFNKRMEEEIEADKRYSGCYYPSSSPLLSILPCNDDDKCDVFYRMRCILTVIYYV